MSLEENKGDMEEHHEGVADPNNTEAEGRRDGYGAVSRRGFLRFGAIAGATAVGSKLGGATSAHAQPAETNISATDAQAASSVEEVSIAELQAAMVAGKLTAVGLVNRYLTRIKTIDKSGPSLNSVLEINPDAGEIAKALDRERRVQGPRGPLHGIPVLLKDNIDTADRMMTTAGSLALVGPAPSQDATVVARLRAAGAIILGKVNLSEWANFRGFQSSSGWSGRGGQTRNPYILDRSPIGSSSGSAAAVAASLCAAALGTETDGSVISPSHANGVVGIKPTVGLTSRAGVIPISATQDTVGVHGRTVADAAAVLGALTGVDPRDPATQDSAGKFHTDYTQFLDPNGLQGARIGVPRNRYFGYSDDADMVIEQAIQAMRDAGAIIVDPADIPTADQLANDPAEFIVLIYEFKRDLNAYLSTRTGVPIHSLAELIAFNIAHADQELKFFGQELLFLAEAGIFSEQDYLDALVRGRMLARQQGIDAVMDQYNLDALVAPVTAPAWPVDPINGDHFLGASTSPAAVAGYPLVTVPAGFAFGLPVGINFMGRAYSEPLLIKLAYAFEQATHARRKPEYIPTLPINDPRPGGGHSRANRRKNQIQDWITSHRYRRYL